MGKGSGTSSRSSVKMWGSGTSLSRFWAWICGAPERARAVLSVKMRISRTAANPQRCRTLCVRAEPAVGGDERALKLKKFWKWWSPERQNPPKKNRSKMVMLRNGIFGNLWKLYALERKFRAENGGLLRGTYPICIHYGSTPPPPGGGGGLDVSRIVWLVSVIRRWRWMTGIAQTTRNAESY